MSKVSISAEDGNLYEYNPGNGLISVNNVIIGSDQFQPVFSNSAKPETPPIFSGILNKRLNKIISLAGKINDIIDSTNIL